MGSESALKNASGSGGVRIFDFDPGSRRSRAIRRIPGLLAGLTVVLMMRTGAFVFIVLLLGGCTSHSLDSARQQLLEAQADYQECVKRSGANNCETKRVVAEDAERAYRDAMSRGLN
jgi:hypothetical protein